MRDWNPEWEITRKKVMERANGICERCREKVGRHVHHFRYWPKRKLGGEPLDWLQLVCLDCHGSYHPRHTFRSVREQKLLAAKRQRGRRRQLRPTCRHCGGLYSRTKHRAICVRFGLDVEGT